MITLDVSEKLSVLRREPGSPEAVLLAGARQIVGRLLDAGFEGLYVGGTVRDILLNRPIHEVDITTSASPEEVAALFKRTVFVGAAFGVVRVILRGIPYEVATFRKERGYSDGRHPDAISPGTVEEDVQRRDFTVNGLVLEPFSGVLRDYIGGIEDLERRRIRAIGVADERMREDYLRCLRAVRFSAVLGFAIEEGTLAAVRAAGPGLARISRERVAAELQKICEAGAAVSGLRLLYDAKLEPYVFPFLPDPEPATREAALRILAMLPDGRDLASLLAALTAAQFPRWILTPETSPEGAVLLGAEADSLRFSAEMRRRLLDTMAMAARLVRGREVRLARRAEIYRSPLFGNAAALARFALEAERGDTRFLDELLSEAAALDAQRLNPPRFLTGNDLASLGVRPGPIYKRLLQEAEDLVVEGTLQSRQDALAWLRANAREETGGKEEGE